MSASLSGGTPPVSMTIWVSSRTIRGRGPVSVSLGAEVAEHKLRGRDRFQSQTDVGRIHLMALRVAGVRENNDPGL